MFSAIAVVALLACIWRGNMFALKRMILDGQIKEDGYHDVGFQVIGSFITALLAVVAVNMPLFVVSFCLLWALAFKADQKTITKLLRAMRNSIKDNGEAS